MSHIVTIKTTVRDPLALAAACRRLGLAEPAHGTANLYSSEATGQVVYLPGWQYPIVIDTATGQIHFDNFQGCWGDQRELDRLLQRYAVEKTLIEARRKGHSISEQNLPDGSVKLTIQMGGAS